ncbi:MAG: type I-U CRISPR-associated protein Csb2 [Dehalococcoidia bacterium]|nr:type I-U CRISPR-associated protein Csb2 [Dehalococcoidia bacterium]
MIAIAFNFTANRFHATQWGRHVNEGISEWPPSPWRILRALVSAWMRTEPGTPASKIVPVLERLAAEPPNFYLPEGTQGHTRHYMPWEKKGPGDRVLVIDSFVITKPLDAVVAIWPNADPTPEHLEVLARLLDSLGYLGRAESWCDAHLMDAPPGANSFPLTEGAPMPQGDWEIVRVLVPKVPLRLKDLCVDISELRGQGKIDPPGARWAQYVRRADCFTVGNESSSGRARLKLPTVFRYALAGSVLPLVTDTLRIAELTRQSAMAQYGRGSGGTASPALSGKAPDGTPLKGHQHAFYLPTDEDDDGHIDHLTIWAPSGFGEEEMNALTRIKFLNPGRGRPEIQLAFLADGEPVDFEKSVPIFGKAQVWRTVTPFVLNRHTKVRGPGGEKRMVDGPKAQVGMEIDRRPQIDMPLESVDLAPVPKIGGWRTVHPLEFHRWRRSGGAGGSAFNFSLRFAGPVAGPIALGYASHFGLGLFVPSQPDRGL